MQTAADETIKINDLICFSVYALSHAFNRVYKPLLDRLGLTYPQYLAMVALWERDNQTVGSLGGRLSLESSTLTPLLKRLEAEGYVTRARDPEDERQVRISLTEKGRTLREQAREVPHCILEATGMPFPELLKLKNEIAALTETLERASER